jgi:hypothetical protein
VNDLFISLYLDEDVDIIIADFVRSHGFNATTTSFEGNKGRSDIAQLSFASERRLTLLTHNRHDFELLAKKYFELQRDHYGIIVAVQRPPFEIARRLLSILNNFSADEFKNQIRYI